MAGAWRARGALLCLCTLPMQSGGVAHADGAPPLPGSRAPISPGAGQETAGWAGVEVAAGKVKSKVGDRDNFGSGLGSGPAPCEFFDRREPEDLGVFDYELEFGDDNDSWTHSFTVIGTPTRVRLVVYEIFADADGPSATIDIDGVTLDFEQGKTALCDGYPEGGVRHAFVLTGESALVAADGVVVVTFHEQGDDISLDRAKLVVTSS